MIRVPDNRQSGAKDGSKQPRENDSEPKRIGKLPEELLLENKKRQARRDADAQEPFLAYQAVCADGAQCRAVRH
jgi:hypothetical protein